MAGFVFGMGWGLFRCRLLGTGCCMVVEDVSLGGQRLVVAVDNTYNATGGHWQWEVVRGWEWHVVRRWCGFEVLIVYRSSELLQPVGDNDSRERNRKQRQSEKLKGWVLNGQQSWRLNRVM
ncbi:hypothetical protein DCAR_0623326 [Daucus carota subsp. sativus]|uniref:Uncharacterized protein n=1 Tax=Daucus carota subsp. sativus TaxID=79200 RepID=A0A175YAZ2_DAUCS|nr:hypothetical protein DCAR_0623326 [Daucus carota subsp. sativus]